MMGIELGAHTTIFEYKQVISHVFSILDNSLDIVSKQLHSNEQKNNSVAKLIHFQFKPNIYAKQIQNIVSAIQFNSDSIQFNNSVVKLI